MPIIEINDVANFGVVKDVEGYMLPPEAWTLGENVRVRDGGIERIQGHTQVFGDQAVGNDSYTKVLLHCDGADAATTFSDTNAGGSAHTWTAAGNAQVDTAQSKFGGSSLLCDGTGDYVATPDHADFALGSGDFTVDFWFNCNAAGGTTELLCGQCDSTPTTASTSFYIGRTNTNVMAAIVANATTLFTVSGTTQFTNAVNTGWHHLALVRTGNTLKMFIDGTQEGGDVAITGTVNNSSNALSVGRAGEITSDPWTGWIDEFRLSVGTARWTAAFSVPTREYMTSAEVTPHFAMPISSSAQTFWLWTSLEKAFVYDGSTHINITRQSSGVDSDYAATNTREWNATLLGGVAVFNNGVDLPQYWSAALSTGTRLANLSNWDSNHRAKVIRAFQNHLVAYNVTKSGTVYPHMVKWSHPADPGSVPSSWDHTDATKDAGENDLSDVVAGVILDAMQLRGHMYIYKEGSIWRQSYIGGSFIFDFDSFVDTAGILAQRCVAVTPDGTRHVVATQDDIIIHNGNSVESVLDKRYRRYLFNQIDTDHYVNSFMYVNAAANEVGFAFPEQGNTNPTRALVWNYREGQLGALAERTVNFRNVASGIIESAAATTWASITGTWAEQSEQWSVLSRRKAVAVHTDAVKFAEIDSGTTILGTAISSTLQRVGLGVEGRKRNGEWIVDFTSQKVLNRIWLKMDGGPVTVRVGFQALPNGAVTWSSGKTFDPTTQRFVDVVGSGKAVAIEISASVYWRLVGYALEGEVGGRH